MWPGLTALLLSERKPAVKGNTDDEIRFNANREKTGAGSDKKSPFTSCYFSVKYFPCQVDSPQEKDDFPLV
jgi:hypothetical protein